MRWYDGDKSGVSSDVAATGWPTSGFLRRSGPMPSVDAALSFGDLLRRYRLAAGLTQEELAERAGLSVRGLSDLERGSRTRPRPHTVRQLAAALALPPSDSLVFQEVAQHGPAGGASGPVGPRSRGTGNALGADPLWDLVGREEETARIRSTLAGMQTGTGHLLLVVGEGG